MSAWKEKCVKVANVVLAFGCCNLGRSPPSLVQSNEQSFYLAIRCGFVEARLVSDSSLETSWISCENAAVPDIKKMAETYWCVAAFLTHGGAHGSDGKMFFGR